MPGTPGFPERKIIIDKQNKMHICIKQVYHQHQAGQALKQVFLKALLWMNVSLALHFYLMQLGNYYKCIFQFNENLGMYFMIPMYIVCLLVSIQHIFHKFNFGCKIVNAINVCRLLQFKRSREMEEGKQTSIQPGWTRLSLILAFSTYIPNK